jgi:ABC-type nitrate/sulfonate/bicarbonate transport system substrate-binding protein
VTSDIFIERNPAAAAAAVRAIVKTQKALKADPRLASEVGRRKFPKEAADLISTVVNRDLVFYDPVILQEEVEAMNRFAQAVGHLSGAVPYDEVVATRFRDSWQ